MTSQALVNTANNIRENALNTIDYANQLLTKSYLSNLDNNYLEILAGYPDEKIRPSTDVRIFRLERITLENKQSMLESLTAAYTALGESGYSVFLLLKGEKNATTVYLGIKGKPQRASGIGGGELLEQLFKGHFTGSQLTQIDANNTNSLLYNLRQSNTNILPSITAVTGVPSLSVKEREHFMQGLENFIDAAEGKEYQALILAEPVNSQQLNSIQFGYEGIASQLSPLLKQSVAFSQNESESIGLSISESISQSLGTSLGLTETKGSSDSLSNTISKGTNESVTNSSSFSSSHQTTKTKSISLPMLGTLGITHSQTETQGKSYSKTHGTSYSETQGKTIGTSSTSGITSTKSQTDTKGITTGQTDTKTFGSSQQITLEMTDKHIERLLKKVDHQLERLEEARRYGAWHSAAYFICDSSTVSKALASIFLGLMRGENSNSENYTLTSWNNKEDTPKILPWLANLSHPRFNVKFSQKLGINYLTPTTLVSSKEMAMQLSLPRRSTSTVAVVEAQTFGRQIQNVNGNLIDAETKENTLSLGHIRHLWQDLPQKVNLNINQLTSHLFVSGSTGSGKSNTIYQILAQLSQNHIPFLVIEPAKGEYKHVFGHNENISVFGTNPQYTPLLKVNPFKFPKDIHILEHIDRLTEIFNVCWPMYAAMPAILKDAMLTAYKTSRWNLENSYNEISDNLYPNFNDLLESLENVINQSAYSDEMKSNYIGSLVTRIRSLTNGLNGQIFSSNEIDNSILFDSNVIVDLSRVGSQETKSLIMGVLVMRLNEHRMAFSGMNQPLKHVTVLEEAHNILKRTSSEQSNEGANIAGKAVEMLSNAIAEMRTYGEGFIIADQSPNSVDISAIRNTNTKIIMRLPDEADRILAGKSSGMTDEQLSELAKLPKGVAIVYQNDWLEPVLCKIHHFIGKEKPYEYKENQGETLKRNLFNLHIARLLLSKQLDNSESYDLSIVYQGIEQFELSTSIKIKLLDVLNMVELEKTPKLFLKKHYSELSKLLVSILDVRDLAQSKINKANNFEQCNSDLNEILSNKLTNTSDKLLFAIKDTILKDFSTKSNEHINIYNAWTKYNEEFINE